jgi:hypothetical protein
MNSSGELVVNENIEVPTGLNTEFGVDDPLFQSESFRTPVRNTGVFWKTSSGHDIFDKIEFLASQTLMTFTTYTIPLDQFTGTTSNVVMVPDQLLIGSHLIIPLQIANPTMVPQVMTVSTGNVVITQGPIGMPLCLDQIHHFPLGIMILIIPFLFIPRIYPEGLTILFLLGIMLLVTLFLQLPSFYLGGLMLLLHICLEDLIVLALVAPT